MKLFLVSILFLGITSNILQSESKTDQFILIAEKNGSVTLKVEFSPIHSNIDSIEYNINIVLIPFKFGPEWRIISADDVIIKLLSAGNDYTLLTAVYPKYKDKVVFRVDNCSLLNETRERKSKIEINFSKDYLSEADKSILLYPTVKKISKYYVVLPNEYEDTEISFYPNTIQKINKTTFIYNHKIDYNEKLWIVFPNCTASEYNHALLIFAILIGLFTVWFNVPAIRDRRLGWAITLFILSLVILFLIVYFSIKLPQGRDFLIWSAAAIPHVLFGFFASIYISLANKYQCIIGGQIRIDGIPADFANVSLFGKNGNKEILIADIDKLNNGRYTFYVWATKSYKKYFIKANAIDTNEKFSAQFTLSKRQKYEVPLLELIREKIETNRVIG